MSATLRVLVVDDEPAIRRFLRTSLGAQGYDVLEAEDGEAGLAMLSAMRSMCLFSISGFRASMH